MSLWLGILLAYLAGSIPFGLLIGRLRGVDLRKLGSGNIGATNALRVLGPVGGVLTLLGDILKGFLPVLGARSLWGSGDPWLYGVALAAVVGHLFPLYLRFQGGKGVATGFGVVLALWPPVGGIALGIWIAVAWIWRYSSLAALVAFGSLPLLVGWWVQDVSAVVFATALMTLVFSRHRSNIERLWRGEERKIGQRTTPPGASS